MASSNPGNDVQAEFFRASQIASILNFIIGALLGSGLIVWAGRVAKLVVPETPPLRVEADSKRLEILGFRLVGVFILIAGLKDAAAPIYTLVTKPEWDKTGMLSYVWADRSLEIVKAAVQIVAGIVLLAGRAAIVRSWLRLRGQMEDDAG